MSTPATEPTTPVESPQGSAVPNEPPDEPTDEQLRSDEARRYRQQLRDTEASAAQMIIDNADREARLQATERQLVNQELAGRFADPGDFWSSGVDLADVRDDQGVVDLAMVSQRADQLLTEHPHWRSADPRNPLVAPAGTVGGAGQIGAKPRSVLDLDNVLPKPTRGWDAFLTDAATQAAPEGPSAPMTVDGVKSP